MVQALAVRSRRGSRPWVIPPGLARCAEPFDGFLVLDELRSDTGVILWQYLRDVDLWSGTPAEARGRLFGGGITRRRRERLGGLGGWEELRLPLEALSRALDGRARAPELQAMHACQAISRWAGDQRLPRTALAFARSAALAAPTLPGPAYAVGQLARHAADPRRAETWFRRALALARRSGAWSQYGLACLGMGALHRERGDLAGARGWYVRALRVARRRGLSDVRPRALQEMFCVAAAAGGREDAETWARRALRAYGPRHPRVVGLAHEVARHWQSSGRHAEALRLWRALLPHLPRIADRRRVTAGIARAAAGVGDRQGFAAMWSECWRLVDQYDEAEGVAEALLALAQGAVALGDSDRAQLAASQAMRVASEAGDEEDRAAAAYIVSAPRGLPLLPVPPRQPAVLAEARRELADRLVQALATGFSGEILD